MLAEQFEPLASSPIRAQVFDGPKLPSTSAPAPVELPQAFDGTLDVGTVKRW
ncbi:hypothetical protein GCM10025760_03090 [Microbacterium yannicii]|uniref:Uncharacterized protein n=1 Tax=Microbacterium yannicii TaxID=671622 RepID=A0ABP9LSU9_9MICO